MKKFKLTESELTKLIQKVVKEDSNDDRPDNWRELPGYNPEYFYGPGSVFSKQKEKEEVEMSKEEITQALIEIHSLLQDGSGRFNAAAKASSKIEGILHRLGKFK